MPDYTPYKEAAERALACENIAACLGREFVREILDCWNMHPNDFNSLIDVLKHFASGKVDEEKNEEAMAITWDIYDDWPDGQEEPNYNFDAGVIRDGIYYVYHNHLGTIGQAFGVEVEDGKFVKEPTLVACVKARNSAGYHGHFLVHLAWHSNKEMFCADFGS